MAPPGDAEKAVCVQLPECGARSPWGRAAPPRHHQRPSAPGSRISCKVDREERRCLATGEVSVFKIESTPAEWSVESKQLCLPFCCVWNELTSVRVA